MKDSYLKNILVVDDEEAYREMLRDFLLKDGYMCVNASNASEALGKLHARHFDLVVSDVKMPKKDGIEFMREAKAVFPQLEFIIMTGHAADYSYSDIINAGATDFISKPFEMSKLKSKLERIEKEKHVLHQLRVANEELQKANKALSIEAGINRSIAELSKAVISALSIDEISRLVLEHVKHLTESPLGYVGYIDRRTGNLVSLRAAEDVSRKEKSPNEDILSVIHAKGGLPENRETLLANAAQDYPRLSGLFPDGVPVHRYLSVPALVGDTLFGRVVLANSERDYTDRDRAMVERLSAVFALAVQRKWMEEELKQVNEHLTNVFDSAAEAIGIVDEHGRFTKWNKAAEKLYGYSYEELKGKRFTDIYADDGELETLLSHLRRDGFVHGREIHFRRKDGTTVPFRTSIRLLKDKNGKIAGSVAVATDLTDIKNSLTRLQLANEQLQTEIAEREKMAGELRKARDELEILVVERTERLSKAGELLKKSIDRFKQITQD